MLSKLETVSPFLRHGFAPRIVVTPDYSMTPVDTILMSNVGVHTALAKMIGVPRRRPRHLESASVQDVATSAPTVDERERRTECVAW